VAVAWAGGAAFAVALIYLGYWYVVILGDSRGDPAALLPNTLVNVALFSVFALHHSVLARPASKRLVTRVVPAAYERTLYVWVASLLAIAMCLFWQPIAGLLYQVDGLWRILFWGVQAAGAAVTLRAASALSALELAGIHQASGRQRTGPLKVVGPFRMVRHPIYLGWIMMVGVAPTMTANRALFAVISSLYLILAIPWEERSLAAAHGEPYREYQRSVRWRLLPGVW
jgi:methanethiol S-methyltransferase